MTLNAEDEEKLLQLVNDKLREYSWVPRMVMKRILKPLPQILEGIPPFLHQYTVAEVMESLENAWQDRRLSW